MLDYLQLRGHTVNLNGLIYGLYLREYSDIYLQAGVPRVFASRRGYYMPRD